jgi:hypothetical protein
MAIGPAFHCWLTGALAGVALVSFAGLAVGEETSGKLAFVANDKGEYTFDTGVLRGVLRPGGKSQGLSSVTYVPTGARLDRSMGILSHYRVFTTNKRYGVGAWDWPSTAKLLPDGAVQVTWPAATDRPFEMGALYRWKDPQTIDLETTVTARADLHNFESFLASYFDAAFPSPYVCAMNQGGEIRWLLLRGEKSYGDWLMFTKSGAGDDVRMIGDGRWKLEPNPVDWTILPRLGLPLCLRRSPSNGLAVILMASRECFAVATPCEGDSHYSLYLSLFGDNLKAGETAKARTRFTITSAPSDDQVIELCFKYDREFPPEPRRRGTARVRD